MKVRLAVAALLAIVVLYPTGKALVARQGSAKPSEHLVNPHSNEPIGTVRQIYDGVLTPDLTVNTFRNTDRLFATRVIRRGKEISPLPVSASPLGVVRISQGGREYDLEQYLELNRVAALLVIKDGRVKAERYRFGNTERTRWMSMSIAKSMTSTLVAAALKQGHIASLSEPVIKYVPVLRGTAYDGVSIRDALMMSSGVRWDETYADPKSDRRTLLEAQLRQMAGSSMEVMGSLQRAAEPGTVHVYSTGETQVVGEIVRAAVKRPLADYLTDRVWSKVGMEDDAAWWLESPGGIEIGGSGISATLRDYGRFGLFMLSDGITGGERILPDGWAREASSPKVLRGGSAISYGYLWWTPPTEPSQRSGAYMARGSYGQRLYINPAEQLVIVVWSARPTMSTGEVIND